MFKCRDDRRRRLCEPTLLRPGQTQKKNAHNLAGNPLRSQKTGSLQNLCKISIRTNACIICIYTYKKDEVVAAVDYLVFGGGWRERGEFLHTVMYVWEEDASAREGGQCGQHHRGSRRGVYGPGEPVQARAASSPAKRNKHHLHRERLFIHPLYVFIIIYTYLYIYYTYTKY